MLDAEEFFISNLIWTLGLYAAAACLHRETASIKSIWDLAPDLDVVEAKKAKKNIPQVPSSK